MSDLAIISNNGSELVTAPMGDWGSSQVSTADILISRILLQQALSDFVTEGKTKPGDLVDSVTGKVLAERGKELEIIPIVLVKNWRISKREKNKFEFQGFEPVTSQNENFPFEYELNGETWRRDKCYNYHVLLAKEAASPSVMPVVVTFTRTSAQAGKAIATHFLKLSMDSKPPAHSVISLKSEQIQGEQGPYFVYRADIGRNTEPNELNAAYKWYKLLQTMNVKVDDAEEISDAKVNGATATHAI